MALIDQEAVMKKSLFVLLVAAMHCGCAASTTPQVDSLAHISYDEFAAEIEISHEAIGRRGETPQPVAANRPD